MRPAVGPREKRKWKGQSCSPIIWACKFLILNIFSENAHIWENVRLAQKFYHFSLICPVLHKRKRSKGTYGPGQIKKSDNFCEKLDFAERYFLSHYLFHSRIPHKDSIDWSVNKETDKKGNTIQFLTVYGSSRYAAHQLQTDGWPVNGYFSLFSLLDLAH